MNAQEKNLMMNPEHKPLMDLPPVVRHLMQVNYDHLLVLRPEGGWMSPLTPALNLGEIYVVASTALVTQPPVQYKQYPVFCGSDRIYKADLTQPNSDSKRIYHLTTTLGMAEFAGIRYKGGKEWEQRLNTMALGEPDEVRFRVR